ncbi:MAG: ParB N-terminal domain-containing protein [Candidatus Woesearchaeota archaeon]|jgi:ParB/RepB/Spo0J family partition protein|nr:ParB N-terminal domain-containing protein [Candidatus Woesearchaeota archaeon]
MVSLALAEDYRKNPEYRQELHMENVLSIIEQSDLNQKTKTKISNLNTYEEVFSYLQEYYGYTFPLKPDYYEKFPVLLLRVASENARNSAVNLNHVKGLSKSYQNTGIIKPPLVTINGLIPDGGHRDLAAINERAEFISVVVGDFEKGARVSAASDSQVKYADYGIVMAIAKSAKYGTDVNDLVAFSNKKRDTINSYIRFGLNAIPELKYAILEQGLPLSHGISVARLNNQDQVYFLKLLKSRNWKSSRKWVDKNVSNFLGLYPNKKTIENIILDSQNKDLSKISTEDELIEKITNISRPTYQVENLNFNLSETQEEDTQQTNSRKDPLEQKSQAIFSYLSKLYQLGFIKQNELKEAQLRLEPTILKNLLNKNETLVSKVKKSVRNNKLEKKIYTFEDAFREVSKGFEEGKAIKAAFELKYHKEQFNLEHLLTNSQNKVVPSRYNVRGTIEDTAKSAMELVDSITEHGILQPVLAYKNEENEIEVICGNRRFLGFKIAQMYAMINGIKSEKLQELPILLINEPVSESDIIKLQIAEDSQRMFTPLEKGALYCQIMTQYKQQGANKILARREAIKEIKKSTSYSQSHIRRQMAYWEDMPESIKDAHTHRIVNTEMLDGLIDLGLYTKTHMKEVLAQALLTERRKKSEVVQMYYGKTDKISEQFDFTNKKLPMLEVITNFNLGHTIAQYIRKSL